MVAELTGRVIVSGSVTGIALTSSEPIGFLGGINPDTGVVVENGHPLCGQSVAGRVLVFPTGKGSTVGSYIIYRLAKNGLGPAAIINSSVDAVTAVGAIIADIPTVDRIDISAIRTGMRVEILGGVVTLA